MEDEWPKQWTVPVSLIPDLGKFQSIQAQPCDTGAGSQGACQGPGFSGWTELSTFCLPQCEIEIRNKR